MNVFTTLAGQFRCLVLPVDHFGKAVETGTRGGSAKEGSADAVLAILGERDISGNVSNPRMAVRKVRGAPTGTEVPFSVRVVDSGVDEDGKAETTLVIDWKPEGAPTKSPKEKWPPSVRVFRDALVDVLANEATERRPLADGPVVRAVDLEAVRAEFYGRYPADGDTDEKRQAARQKQFRRGLNYAQTTKLVGVAVLNKVTLIWLSDVDANARTL